MIPKNPSTRDKNIDQFLKGKKGNEWIDEIVRVVNGWDKQCILDPHHITTHNGSELSATVPQVIMYLDPLERMPKALAKLHEGQGIDADRGLIEWKNFAWGDAGYEYITTTKKSGYVYYDAYDDDYLLDAFESLARRMGYTE